MEATKKLNGKAVTKWLSNNAIIVMMLAVSLIVGIMHPNFFSGTNMINLFKNVSIRYIIALGISGCLITTGNDLSAGRLAGFAACLACIFAQTEGASGKFYPNMHTLPTPVVFILVIAICAIVGLCNGLVVSYLKVQPFKTTIERQYARRAELFPGTDILPQFADLRIVQAVQGLAGADTGYASWFDALAAMEQQMDAAPYDVAIIGAGAYGLPLAAHARDTGHAAIQMSGALQLLFGIRGKRWDDHPVISKLYNDAWVRPEETLAHKEKVEGGSYW